MCYCLFCVCVVVNILTVDGIGGSADYVEVDCLKSSYVWKKKKKKKMRWFAVILFILMAMRIKTVSHSLQYPSHCLWKLSVNRIERCAVDQSPKFSSCCHTFWRIGILLIFYNILGLVLLFINKIHSLKSSILFLSINYPPLFFLLNCLICSSHSMKRPIHCSTK